MHALFSHEPPTKTKVMPVQSVVPVLQDAAVAAWDQLRRAREEGVGLGIEYVATEALLTAAR